MSTHAAPPVHPATFATPVSMTQGLVALAAPVGWYARGKPLLDFALAAVLAPRALVLVAVAVAAVAVRLTSAGPAFYTQTRLGRDGRPFAIVKLRTMRHRCARVVIPGAARRGSTDSVGQVESTRSE